MIDDDGECLGPAPRTDGPQAREFKPDTPLSRRGEPSPARKELQRLHTIASILADARPSIMNYAEILGRLSELLPASPPSPVGEAQAEIARLQAALRVIADQDPYADTTRYCILVAESALAGKPIEPQY